MQCFVVTLKARKGYRRRRGTELHTQMRSTTVPDKYDSNFKKILNTLAQVI